MLVESTGPPDTQDVRAHMLALRGLPEWFDDPEVAAEAFKAAGLARGGKDGVRLLGKGELKAKLALKVAGASKGARQAVEKAGGSIELIERKNPAELAAAKKGSRKAAAGKAEA